MFYIIEQNAWQTIAFLFVVQFIYILFAHDFVRCTIVMKNFSNII